MSQEARPNRPIACLMARLDYFTVWVFTLFEFARWMAEGARGLLKRERSIQSALPVALSPLRFSSPTYGRGHSRGSDG